MTKRKRGFMSGLWWGLLTFLLFKLVYLRLVENPLSPMDTIETFIVIVCGLVVLLARLEEK